MSALLKIPFRREASPPGDSRQLGLDSHRGGPLGGSLGLLLVDLLSLVGRAQKAGSGK